MGIKKHVIFSVLTAACSLMVLSTRSTAVTYDDGGSYTSDTNIYEGIILRNGSSLDILPGANIDKRWQDGKAGVYVLDSSVTMYGGSVIGEASHYSKEATPGFEVWRSQLTIRAGNVSGGRESSTGYNALPAIALKDKAKLAITGGVFSGSRGTQVGGYALELNNGSSATIHNGKFSGGGAYLNGKVNGNGGGGLRMFGGTVEVYGGMFNAVDSFQGSTAVSVGNQSHLSIYGGTFNSAVSLYPRCGNCSRFYGDLAIRTGVAAGYPGPVINIFGGHINGDIGLDNLSILNVHGRGLSLKGERLSGTLDDGSLIDILVYRWGEGAQINIINR